MAASSSVCSRSVETTHIFEGFPGLEQIPGLVRRWVMNPQGLPLAGKIVQVSARVGLNKVVLMTCTDQIGYLYHKVEDIKPILGKKITATYVVLEKDVYDSSRLNPISPKMKVEFKVYRGGNVLPPLVVDYMQVDHRLPTLLPPKDLDMRPQKWPYAGSLVKGNWDTFLQLFVANFDDYDNVQEVQQAFATGNTYLPLTCERTIEMITNGIYPCHFLKGEELNTLEVRINWDKYERKEKPDLSNVKMTLNYEEEKLSIRAIEIEGGKLSGTYLPGQKGFDAALFIFNCSALLRGQVVSHLGIGHFVTGQFALAMFSTLTDNNPIKRLLTPHLRGVLEINRIGETRIFGETGVLAHSALTAKGTLDLVRDTLGSICWKTFTPRKPLNQQNTFAHILNIWWNDILENTVNQFFSENKSEIIHFWPEIFKMSELLVSQSVPYCPPEGVSDRAAWYDTSEIDDPTVPGRETIDGELKSVRPITKNPIAPDEEDWGNLRQFLKYCLLIAIVWHGEVHESQDESTANFNFASIAPNYDAAGVPLYGGITVDDAVAERSIIHILMNTKTSVLIENERKDIYYGLLKWMLHFEDKLREQNRSLEMYREGTDI